MTFFALTLTSHGLAQKPAPKDHVKKTITSSRALQSKISAHVPYSSKPKNAELVLEVAIVSDPKLPKINQDLIAAALESAAKSFEIRFGLQKPYFVVTSSLSVSDFMQQAPLETSKYCLSQISKRYRGTGPKEFEPYEKKAKKFLKRWSLKSLTSFVTDKKLKRSPTYDGVYEHLVDRYVATVQRLAETKTRSQQALVRPKYSTEQSFAAWNCALREQRNFDVVITNAFIMADVMSEPHPHAFFGKAKVGGIATLNPHRNALGKAALLVTTFAIDTPITWLSELDGKPAHSEERAEILGDYLLAHEIAHAIIGIPDVYDHPEECLMTSRPNQSYRVGLQLLREHQKPCSRCRKWVDAYRAYSKARKLLSVDRPKSALRYLARASKITPKHFHGGYRKKMSDISYLVAKAYAEIGRKSRSLKFARRALELNPRSTEAQNYLETLTSTRTRP
ncbi:MAG: hypothetical protein VYC39_00120 [Myxococcota bacterium]|nr:hypothetical protein [Myxococcota bacterium]